MGISAKMCEIVSDTQHLTLETIKRVIGEQSCIDKYLYILHDKDVDGNGKKKNPHYHVYLHFNNARDFDYIGKWFGVSSAFVSKIKGRFDDAIAYALHRNALDKHQYDESEAVANFDFKKTVANALERKEKKKSLTAIIEGIENGEIKQYNITDRVSITDYVTYERQINRAFEYKLKELQREVNRNMEVVYMYGKSGTGKTTYAKIIAKKQGYEVFTSSGSNDPFDGYKGQECVILDDLRGSVFPLSDLLKILDNNTSSSVKARYKNINLQCKLLIITTTKTPADFYKAVFESRNEEFKQFMRRCTQLAYVEQKEVTLYTYNNQLSKHEYMCKFANPVAELVALNKFNKEKSMKHLQELFSFAEKDLKAVQEYVANNADAVAERLADASSSDASSSSDADAKQLVFTDFIDILPDDLQ